MNSRMQGFERDVMAAAWKGRSVWALHLAVNALLIVTFFYWTQIPEATGWQFAGSMLSGLLIVFVALWLHCGTLDYFAEHFASRESSVQRSLRSTVSRVPAFLVWAVVFGFGFWVLGQLWDYTEQAGGWARHVLPEFLRHMVTPRLAFSLTSGVVAILFFGLWPIVFLPVGAQVAARSFRGFFEAAALRPVREWRFWVFYIVCFVGGIYVPYRLAWMTPIRPSTLHHEMVSVVARFGFGYVLLVTAWLILCAAIQRASKRQIDNDPDPASPKD